MGKLIIIEGSDGSGKQTQTNLLFENLKSKYTNEVLKISFPNYEKDSSIFVKMYLSGEFGKDVNSVNPYVASLFYSLDRYYSYKKIFGKSYENGAIIISDRYTTANMVHQASKIKELDKRYEFINWLEDIEYNKIGIPKPDMVIFLNVDYKYSKKLMAERKNKITGEEEKDIHEANENYLKECYYNSYNLAKKLNWEIIDCVENDKMLSIEEISNKILKVVEKLL